jgi:hypothetical protein
MIPQHLVSHMSAKDTHNTTSYIDNIDPALTQQIARDNQGLRKISTAEKHHKYKLNRNNLEKEMGRGEHEFEWSNPPGIDSAYGSGNMQDPQDLDTPFSQDVSIPYDRPLHPPRPEDTLTSVMFTKGGDSDDAEIDDYDKYLNI